MTLETFNHAKVALDRLENLQKQAQVLKDFKHGDRTKINVNLDISQEYWSVAMEAGLNAIFKEMEIERKKLEIL